MILFFTEDINFDLRDKNLIKRWLRAVAKQDGFKITDLNYIFCSDRYLLDINKQFLGHDYYTDIITFDNKQEEGNIVCGDIFISLDTVYINGDIYREGFQRELMRVMVHGLLHLTVYDDVDEKSRAKMRAAENRALDLLASMQG
ncbi:MAG: rRNA maturation RNase YbeY [Bacteroidales bacterium]|nr:rRNA maturation RNase YbeY [Bacteroidales bacterium]